MKGGLMSFNTYAVDNRADSTGGVQHLLVAMLGLEDKPNTRSWTLGALQEE